jgi:hypothetical protein
VIEGRIQKSPSRDVDTVESVFVVAVRVPVVDEDAAVIAGVANDLFDFVTEH